MAESLDINGEPPNLAGKYCEELLCQQYWHGDELLDAINVLFLRVGSVWHRLCFDFGIIFWRISEIAPTSWHVPDTKHQYRIVDLGTEMGIRGQQLDGYEMEAIEGGCEVAFLFAGGRSIKFRNVADQTSLVE